jgi:type I restriction enzyme S subunit
MRVVHDAVLVCGVGATVGRVGFAEGPISTNQQITAVCTDHDAVFWYYALTGARQELVRLSVGNTLPILNNERLNSLFVAIPPLREQREIAAHLDNETAKIDTLIGKAERFIELAKERRSALITAAVTGQIDVRPGASRRNVDTRRQMTRLMS